MADNILVAVAWPYANGHLHVGHVAGAYLPADIFARYQRLRGNNVLMISGSDCHGTPITLQAAREGVAPQDVIRRYHASFVKTFQALGISFDLFTQTYTENHYAATRAFFLKLLKDGYLYKKTGLGSYSESMRRFLPDRFVEGICPNCGYTKARGDQCDNCGTLHEPSELREPHSTLDGGPVSFRETEHFMLDLPKLEPALRSWLDSRDRSYWRSNTLQFTSSWLREGLQGRAITRDLEWGVPVPTDAEEFKDKRIYVWFDAVIGYYSATLEWAERKGDPERWRDWWENPQARSYYFIGKDNIPFHTIIWPAILLGHGNLNLPYDVPANEFYNLEGEKMSTSRGWALWANDLQTQFAPDALRYYLAASSPEGRDTSWYWSEFVRRNNDELVATWGNLVHRVLNIAHRHFGRIPEAGTLEHRDRHLLAAGAESFERVGALLNSVQIKAALQEALSLAQRTNQYISEQEPWKLVKTNAARAQTVIHVGLQLIDYLKVLLCPFLPFSSQQLHAMLGYHGTIAPQPRLAEARDPDGQVRQVLSGNYETLPAWSPTPIAVGQAVDAPAMLFKKLELTEPAHPSGALPNGKILGAHRAPLQ
jgi:methionyl-tRNA synthetase